MIEARHIFIVGASRSGTTMMGRILAKNVNIFTFNEIHFFGTLWSSKSIGKISYKDAVKLLSKLLCVQRESIFQLNKHESFNAEAKEILNTAIFNKYQDFQRYAKENKIDYIKCYDSEFIKANTTYDAIEIYKLFLLYILKNSESKIACEQTPKNIYYAKEILKYFPKSLIINMVRDQRDVLLSQKNKWKRRFLGASKIPYIEALRSYVNYHPIISARIWNSSLLMTSELEKNPRVKIILFEKLLSSPENTIKEICSFLSIDFDKNMLKIPVVGSSTENDFDNKMQIDKMKINKWRRGGLNNSEIYLSQLFSFKMMNKFNYKIKRFNYPPFFVIFYILNFLIKLFFSFLFNIRRTANIIEYIKKIFFPKCK